MSHDIGFLLKLKTGGAADHLQRSQLMQMIAACCAWREVSIRTLLSGSVREVMARRCSLSCFPDDGRQQRRCVRGLRLGNHLPGPFEIRWQAFGIQFLQPFGGNVHRMPGQ